MATATNGNNGNGGNGNNGNGNANGNDCSAPWSFSRTGRRPLQQARHGMSTLTTIQARTTRMVPVKRYRPHMFVMIALAIVLAGGWHNSLRHAIGRPAVRLAVAAGLRRYCGDRDRRILDRQDRRLAVAAPALCRADPAASEGGRPGHRARCRLLHALRRGVGPNLCRSPQGAGGSIVLPSFQQPRTDRTTLHVNRPLPQFAEHSWSALVNVEVGSDGLVRRYPFGEKLDGKFVPSMAAVLGRPIRREAHALSDRLAASGRRASPKCPLPTCCAATRRHCKNCRARRSSSAARRSNSATAFSVPNGAIVSGPVLQTLAAESRCCRTARCNGPRPSSR